MQCITESVTLAILVYSLQALFILLQVSWYVEKVNYGLYVSVLSVTCLSTRFRLLCFDQTHLYTIIPYHVCYFSFSRILDVFVIWLSLVFSLLFVVITSHVHSIQLFMIISTSGDLKVPIAVMFHLPSLHLHFPRDCPSQIAAFCIGHYIYILTRMCFSHISNLLPQCPYFVLPSPTHARAHMPAHARPRTHSQTHTHIHTHAHTHARTHPHTHSRAARAHITTHTHSFSQPDSEPANDM